MLNTLNNLSRKADIYGNLHFISFLGATLSRLAYMNDNQFLTSYSQIMGPVIHPRLLQGINNVYPDQLDQLFDDQAIFGLTQGQEDIFKDYEYQHNNKNFIDLTKLNIPANINIINGDSKGEKKILLVGQEPPPNSVKYISIAWSNYGEIYVVADKRMPNTILLLFRGTYSAKTAALYSKPTSVVPLSVCSKNGNKEETFLYGIFKASSEMIHTIIETIRYLATDFLNATAVNSVKIFTTGHSLGGAMCSNFAYLWMGIKQTPPYNTSPYNILANNIICVSLGAPRCMGTAVANKFCNFVKQKKIVFLRITTRGDPVPALPPKTGFQHPCSDDSTMRMEISEDCNSTLNVSPYLNVNYKQALDCQNYKTRAYIPNPLSHTIYLDIIYTKAVDIPKFLKGMGIAQEVFRGPDKSTMCRLIMGQQNNYKAVFFDVNKSREVPSNLDAVEDAELSKVDPSAVSTLENQNQINGGGFLTKPTLKIGGKVEEDRRMTLQSFQSLVSQMSLLSGNMCPQSGPVVNSFTNQMMPDLSCMAIKVMGGSKRRRRKKTNKYYFSRKSQTRRRRHVRH